MELLLFVLIFTLVSVGLLYYAKCLFSDKPSLLKTITEYFEAKSERKKGGK